MLSCLRQTKTELNVLPEAHSLKRRVVNVTFTEPIFLHHPHSCFLCILLAILCFCLCFSIQADLDLPDLLDTPLDSPNLHRDILSAHGLTRQYSRDAATSTVSIQGSGNRYHACASDDYDDVGFDPSILPPPDPWIDTVTDDLLDANFNSSAILEVCFLSDDVPSLLSD